VHRIRGTEASVQVEYVRVGRQLSALEQANRRNHHIVPAGGRAIRKERPSGGPSAAGDTISAEKQNH
jgi:hypothetical protein